MVSCPSGDKGENLYNIEHTWEGPGWPRGSPAPSAALSSAVALKRQP